MQGQMKNLMKQAQQMQAKLAKVQEELKKQFGSRVVTDDED